MMHERLHGSAIRTNSQSRSAGCSIEDRFTATLNYFTRITNKPCQMIRKK